MPELKLCLLGSPQIELNGEPTQVDARKGLALLAYLAVTGQNQGRDTLAALFWPESDRARAALRWTLSNLKKAIGPTWLEIERESLGLQPGEGVWLDVAQFERLTAPCPAGDHPSAEACPKCAERLSQAVALYRGDFMAGFSLPDSPGFDDWQRFQAEHLRAQVTGALGRLVGYHSARREYERAIAHAQRWLALDPLREAAHCCLMELYAWAGQRADALRQYQECQQVLEAELSLPPQPETDQLAQAIEENREPAPPPRPLPAHMHNLPPQPTPFVGREEELTEIDRLLRDPACRLLTLLGPGGVGKTRLALEAAADKLESFGHGVYLVPLAPLSSPDSLVPAIADALKLSFHSRGEIKGQLLDYLREKQALLLLDNFEHLLAGAELLSEILPQARQVKLLVTSRQRLNLSWEWLFDVQGLPFPKNGNPKSAEDYAAVQLFGQGARRIQPRFRLTEERPHVVRICQLVEGLPLAIELASAQVREHPCAQIAQQIEHNLNLLATTLRDVPARHRSLRAAFEHSWDLLSATEREAFARLSVFRGGFQAEAAEGVAGASPGLLGSLVAKSLLRQVSTERYEILEILRQYGDEKLSQTPHQQTQTQKQHCEHFVTLLEQRESALRGRGQIQAVETIRREIENVRSAWRWALETAQAEQIDRCCESLFLFYELQSWFQEGEERFSEAVEKLCAESETVHKLQRRRGLCLHKLGRYEEAQQLLQKELDEELALKNPAEAALCMSGLGRIAVLQKECRQAKEIHEQALTLIQASKNLADPSRATRLRHQKAINLQDLGEDHWFQGDYVRARDYFEQALYIYRELGRQKGQADVLSNLGVTCRILGDYTGAMKYLEQALPIYTQLSSRYGEARTLLAFGNVFHCQGDYAKAITHYEQVADITRDIGYRRVRALTLNNLGAVFSHLGDYTQARRYYDDFLRLCRELGDQYSESIAFSNLSLLYYHLGDSEAARECGQRSLSIAQDAGHRHHQGLAWSILGYVLEGLKRPAEATKAYEQALALWREMASEHRAMEAMAGLARLSLAQGDSALAQAQITEVLTCSESNTLEGTIKPFRVYLTCYHVLRAAQDPRTPHVLTTAYNLLQERVGKISDEGLQTSFLENVADHREILREYARLEPTKKEQG